MSIMKNLFRWLCIIFCLICIAAIVLGSGLLGFRLFQLEWKAQGDTNLVMREVNIPFANDLNISKITGSLPFMAGVVIDLDKDHRDEVFLGGGRNQSDALLRYDDVSDGFVDISDEHDLSKNPDDATMGGVSIDVDNDGDSDLLVARESGIWLYLSNGGRLSGRLLPLIIESTTTPISITPGDVNGDGEVDFYVSGYIKNELVEGQTIFSRPYGGYSHLFVNEGGLSWRDASREYGVWRQHNTFTAVFADIDNDDDSDLVIAQDTGHVEMYENTGAPPFKIIENPSVNSYPMGIAAGDLNNDGWIDFYFSNVGHTLPKKMLRGDIPKDDPFNELYMYFQNNGDLTFTDVAKIKRTARLGFGWGSVATDLNLDGWQDLVVAQNYAKFGQPAIIHRYNGKIMQNYAGKEFRPVEKKSGASNPHFAISPLIGDYNGDNLPDIVWANLNGISKAFLNETPGVKAIAIDFSDRLKNQNAKVTAMVNGRVIKRQSIIGQGVSSDQTSKMMIGLGVDDQADSITIEFMNGRLVEFSNITHGSVLVAEEVQ